MLLLRYSIDNSKEKWLVDKILGDYLLWHCLLSACSPSLQSTVFSDFPLLFPENEELFKERDRRDEDFLGRLKDFKIDTLEAQAQMVRILFVF